MELKGNMTRFLEGEEHLHFEGDVCEDWMETIVCPKHFQHLQQHLQQHQQHTYIGRSIGY
jgi:hypothetical protein